MAKKERKGRRGNEEKESIFSSISEETWNAIWGVLFALLTARFVMASLALGGKVGRLKYKGLYFLFGIG